MLQLSKVIQSRDEWKSKATQRANENREHRKTEKRHQEKIAELKEQITALEKSNNKKKTFDNTNIVEITQATETRSFCILLVLNAVVSYRSVPRILSLFNSYTSLNLNWIPHFTSVINWTLRVGLGLMAQVYPTAEPWVAIIDHSIDIGTKKALVVLRVKMNALSQRGSAIRLEDCECVGLKICETVNGDTVAADLSEIFERSGLPDAIIKDCDATLQKGVRLCSKKHKTTIPVIEDIGHVIASALKAEFEKTTPYKRFISTTNTCASRLRQTDLAFLIPPKLRTKGRFQSISKLGKWADKMLTAFTIKDLKEDSNEGKILKRLRVAMPEFFLLKPFIKRFAETTQRVSQLMEILKNKGLTQTTYQQCQQLATEFPEDSKVKKRLQTWLDEHLKIQQQAAGQPLLVSSDIIESLFGNFKHIMERSPQADMNRSVLLIPALCGGLDYESITQALNQAPHADLMAWEKKCIPYTVRKKRQEFLNSINIQKTGK